MIIFLDENDVEYGALATIKATNAVNGERSITGEIISGDIVLSRIERGWRLHFEDEYYVVTYAKPIDEGKNVRVSFDAVHQFFWDFGKSSVYDQLSDGSHTFRAYLDFIFNGSGYKYDIESSLMVKAFEKQSFGYKNRLSLFNDIITSSGVEFQVNGKVVRILAKVGTDLSTVVRKNFNLNELGIEKNIGDFVTYQKGFGAYFDEEDHSKGRLIAEYTSPLASVYGKLEADPLVDERYKQKESLLSALKETVDNSYTISVSLDMEDLTRAGYRYTQPVAGDYIMAINETLGFKEKIRIVSFTSEYDVAGQLIKHTVTCNDIGSVKKLSASYTQTQHQAANAEENANTAYEFANKALVSANGKNTNYYGDTFPVDNPKGTLKKGDLLFLTVGDTVKQYYWNGAEWVTNPVVSDVEAFKEQIAEELKDVPNREEFENKISEEIANSKAEITTQIETAKTQAESNAKEYADTINQETAKVAELANAAADEIKADLVNVKNNLTATSLVANNAQAAVDKAKQDLTEVASDLNTAKQDLASHAQQLQTQANAQTELTKRVTTVETTANGTKTTVSELSKTVDSNTKNITSVTARTKVVEDDLTSTKTTLSQVKTTADSTSQKTATLETGLDGVKADLAATTATADTTKTNLANYQASNDRAVANLQSNLQTANGNISSLQTKVEAVPGQITSAVSAVEGKILTSVGGRNLWIQSKATGDFVEETLPDNHVTGQKKCYRISNYQQLYFNIEPDFSPRLYQKVTFSAWVKYENVVQGTNNWNVFNCFKHSLYYKNSSTGATSNISYLTLEGFTGTSDWKRITYTYDYSANKSYDQLKTSIKFNLENARSGTAWVTGVKIGLGSIPSDYSPAPEDTAEQISSLSSEIKQTADGITLLATKTELNAAKNELQSGINTATNKANSNAQTISTHTTQISALNTGLSAKVSQTDFNTLSGRVTNAENNITAKANELSSKITSVESKIPTSVGGRNLALGTSGDWSAGWTNFNGKSNQTIQPYRIYNRGFKIGDKINVRIVLKYSDIVAAEGQTPLGIAQCPGNVTNWDRGGLDSGRSFNFDGSNGEIEIKSTTVVDEYVLKNKYWAWQLRVDYVASGKIQWKEAKVEVGDLPTPWSPAPEDVEGKIPTDIRTVNLVKGTGSAFIMGYGITNTTWNETKKQTILDFSVPGVRRDITSEILPQENKFFDFKPIKGTTYTQSIMIDTDATFNPNGEAKCTWFTYNGHNLQKAYIKKVGEYSYQVWSTYTWNLEDTALRAFDWCDLHNILLFRTTGTYLAFYKPKLTIGNLPSDWSPAPEDYYAALTQTTSEFKQTTDAIKASVSSLDNSTVKNSSLTINSDGIVMKAGKSTTDVANAIGSYFAVNQNAINLFSDKINVKGHMIVSGAITSDKIASKQINTAHLNGKIITADVISSNAVTADAIRAGAVTTDKMSANSINGDRITAGTLDAAKIKAGSITASQIASGTITSNQIKAGGISAANIAAGAITGDKIAANSIDASKIAANAITANMIKGGQLRSTNGATVFDLNAGTLTFNNDSGYIQRVVKDKIFAIQTWLGADSNSRDWLASSFSIRKSDNSRRSGIQFQLYHDDIADKPTAFANMWADSFHLGSSKGGFLLIVNSTNTSKPNWGDIPIAHINGGLIVKDIAIGGHFKSLLNIVEELCNKTGIPWV